MNRQRNFVAVIILAILFVVALHFPLSTIGGLLVWQILMNILSDPILFWEYDMTQQKINRVRENLYSTEQPDAFGQVKAMFEALDEYHQKIGIDAEEAEVLLQEADEEFNYSPSPTAWNRVTDIISNMETPEETKVNYMLEFLSTEQRMTQGYC